LGGRRRRRKIQKEGEGKGREGEGRRLVEGLGGTQKRIERNVRKNLQKNHVPPSIGMTGSTTISLSNTEGGL
jgi:hypothetical protein